jgi:hypothetical protein
MCSTPPVISSYTVGRGRAVAALVDVGQLDGVADGDGARVGRLLAGEHLEQRGLAGAVGADDADDAGLGQRERQVLDEQLVAEALAQVLHLDDLCRPGGCPTGMVISSLSGPALGGLGLLEQLVVGGEAGLALGLAGLGRHAHPLELAGLRCAGGSLPASPPGEALLLLLQPARVVALERDAAAAVQLQDPPATLSRK